MLCSKPFSENHAVYETMLKNIVKPGKLQMAIWRLHVEYWITEATNTHSEYVVFIAFALQQSMQGGASMLRHTYIACLV